MVLASFQVVHVVSAYITSTPIIQPAMGEAQQVLMSRRLVKYDAMVFACCTFSLPLQSFSSSLS